MHGAYVHVVLTVDMIARQECGIGIGGIDRGLQNIVEAGSVPARA